MSTHDPNWSDDEFDAPDEGFLPRQHKVVEPISAYASSTQPIIPPQKKKSGSAKRTVILLLLFFATAIGLGVSKFACRPEPGVVLNDPGPTPIPEPPKPEPPKPEPPKSEPPKPEPPEPEATINAIPRKSQTETALKNSSPASTNRVAGNQEWSIQVFASTSSDDADEWDQRLKAKSIDSRIEMTERCGQQWYRVRFGSYATKEEAEQVAKSLGFRNAWINRKK